MAVAARKQEAISSKRPEFRCPYQPIVAKSGSITGLRALVRLAPPIDRWNCLSGRVYSIAEEQKRIGTNGY